MEVDTSEEEPPIKRCFVTVGATASFFGLVKEVLSEPFLTALLDQGYNDLRVQYGKGGQKLFEDRVWLLSDDIKSKITISGFEYDKNGLLPEMQAAKRDYKSSPYPGLVGCAVSHAGSGSVLESLRVDLPTIVVPNPDLLHNHQLELAEILAEQNYVIHGQLGKLKDAVPQVEELKMRSKQWPPIQGINEKTPRETLQNVVDEELGFID